MKMIHEGNRGVIAISGFYIWKKLPGTKFKSKFYVYDHTCEHLFIPVMFNDNERSFIILTAPASSELTAYHHRQPVVFNTYQETQDWMYGLDVQTSLHQFSKCSGDTSLFTIITSCDTLDNLI